MVRSGGKSGAVGSTFADEDPGVTSWLVLCEVIEEMIKRLAELIGEPIKLTGKRALRKALLVALHRLGYRSIPLWLNTNTKTLKP
jgi:hypothetical protein